MHLIKIFLLIVFNLIIIVFMTQNSNEKVDIFFPYDVENFLFMLT